MPTTPELDESMLLRSLTQVGPAKPVGYLPLDTIRNFAKLSVEAIVSAARTRGLVAVQFGADASCIKSGALYVYDHEALSGLLQAQASALAAAGLPVEPDPFIEHIAAVWYPEDHPAYRIIASAFGDAA